MVFATWAIQKPCWKSTADSVGESDGDGDGHGDGDGDGDGMGTWTKMIAPEKHSRLC